MVTLADFKSGKSKVKQHVRHTALTGVIGMMIHLSGDAYVLPKLHVDLNTPEGKKAFSEFNKDAIEAGYEGIMVKDPEAPYETKRTAHWLKVKPYIEVTLTIVDHYEGEKDFVGKLGGWVMEGEEDGRKIKVNCGGGFGIDERDEYWAEIMKNPNKYKGFLGEVRADSFTQEQHQIGTNEYSLRFPRWKGFRGTVRGEKL
jgi:DNA ligase 1